MHLESVLVVHRGVCAQNVLVHGDGRTVKLAGFGLARSVCL